MNEQSISGRQWSGHRSEDGRGPASAPDLVGKPLPPDPPASETVEAAQFWHDRLNADPLLPDCSGTHSMGYGYCQRLAALYDAPPASETVEAARHDLDAAAALGINYIEARDAFEAAIRAAALDEARAAVEACNIAIVWYNDRTPLAAIDALRERSDATEPEDLPDHEPDCPMFDHPNDKTAPACTCSWRERSGE